MKRRRLTLVGPTEEATASSDALDTPPVRSRGDVGPPRLRLVRSGEGSSPDDAA
jgi:hypothetical protein